MMRLLCVIVVEESCLLSSDKNESNVEWTFCACGVTFVSIFVGALELSNAMPSIDKYILPPYYSDYTLCAK